jgi:hypothetical protein
MIGSDRERAMPPLNAARDVAGDRRRRPLTLGLSRPSIGGCAGKPGQAIGAVVTGSASIAVADLVERLRRHGPAWGSLRTPSERRTRRGVRPSYRAPLSSVSRLVALREKKRSEHLKKVENGWGTTTRANREVPLGSAVNNLYGSGGRRHRPLMGTLRHPTLATLIEASLGTRTHERSDPSKRAAAEHKR